MARLVLTLLGGFRARLHPGAPPLALPTRKAQALLAYLAVPLGSAHPRDKLAGLLWGNTLETTARTSLRQTLYALRKSLRDAVPQPLIVDGETVALDSSAVTVDVHEFEQRAAATTASALAEASADAVAEAERFGNATGHTWRLVWLGEALLLAGRLDEAATRANQALEQSRQRSERGYEAWTLRLQAEVAASRKAAQRAEARERFGEALALARELEMRPLEARCHLGLAALHQADGRTDEASAARAHAITLLRSMGMHFWLSQAQGLRLGGEQSIQ